MMLGFSFSLVEIPVVPEMTEEVVTVSDILGVALEPIVLVLSDSARMINVAETARLQDRKDFPGDPYLDALVWKSDHAMSQLDEVIELPRKDAPLCVTVECLPGVKSE